MLKFEQLLDFADAFAFLEYAKEGRAARILQTITKGALTCDLEISPRGSSLIITMRIVAPSLGNYSVTLVQVAHEMIVYPCIIQSPFLGNESLSCDDEAQLEAVLKRISQDPKTRKLIDNLLQQIRAENSIAA